MTDKWGDNVVILKLLKLISQSNQKKNCNVSSFFIYFL